MKKKCDPYTEYWKDKLKGLNKNTKKELKNLINRYYLLDSMVYVYCIERKNSAGKKFLDPIIVDYETPAIMAGHDLIELQNTFKKDINFFNEAGIKTSIVPMTFPAFWELNASIVPSKETKNKYGTSFIAHKDTYITGGEPEFVHGLLSFDFDNICTKNLNSEYQIVERQRYVPIIVESAKIE